jgi:hypothetical protein
MQLTSFVAIVLALALSCMVKITHHFIRARARVIWDIRALLAAAILFLSVLSEFFSIWGIGGGGSFSFLDLLGLMASPTRLSLAALAVLPDEVPKDGLDLAKFYLANLCFCGFCPRIHQRLLREYSQGMGGNRREHPA